MAPKKNTETVETESRELSPEAIAAREAVASRPRQSVVRFLEYYLIIRDSAPDELDRLFGDQVEVLEAHAAEIDNPIQKAIEAATKAQTERAVKALENDDALNGYANFVFDEEKFAEKTRVKQPRTKKTIAEKAEDLFSNASAEDLDALAEMMKARGLV
ncbi:hypothetical protein SEA_UNPHAZED_26 [Microbacterium phage Unphazed]|uniref:Uncharacterized protein n=4 Tax=Tinytimothyvirus alex44 TaxID=2845588 RepID=A0A7G9A0F9_9CAUD|nr:hypothetical protein SEA_ARMAWEN_25 [Microbacterium phage ArMaWen]QDF16054.1 hypothetical protein SEA_LILYLOU_26 [Microbacterium phage LilyLou]QJD52770.1 hypothetical protein SEA_UNPHAZED_26 [Microbacterium phage Unphazed]QJD52824.1 hypothetical protein SEA_PHOGO_26 [Microbacterium phage Phogo]QNL30098.1 hypothetical protein SEA_STORMBREAKER_25 [Microbacterium phage Stormbreaker]UTN92890.1 hypothetical protein SEA_BIRDFEEDER_24 [Microbacterium phage Birdfeeder]WNM73236.1 hypothetical prote